MKLMAALLLMFVISGCAELVSYTIGTLGNVTGDLIMREIDNKKEQKNNGKETENAE